MGSWSGCGLLQLPQHSASVSSEMSNAVFSQFWRIPQSDIQKGQRRGSWGVGTDKAGSKTMWSWCKHIEILA